MPPILRPQDLTFILVRPRYGGNIGSAARVLKNMGFSKLAVVRPTVLPTHPEALRLAVGAADLLKKAKVFETIEDATKDMRYLIGTSRRTGRHRRDFVDLPHLLPKMPLKTKVGILFGAEERGLTNEDLSFCHLVTMIPSNPDFPSLNLAHSVAVVSYELRMKGLLGLDKVSENEIDPETKAFLQGPGKKHVEDDLAKVEELEGMFRHLETSLTTVGFLNDNNNPHMMRSLRQIFGRSRLTSREARLMRGVCRQIDWKTRKQN